MTLKGGNSYSSPEVEVKPGDAVFGNMTRLSVDSFVVTSVVVSSGVATSLKPQAAPLTLQPWAYVTLECYGCLDCSTYPVQPVEFSHMAFVLDNGDVVDADWAVRDACTLCSHPSRAV